MARRAFDTLKSNNASRLPDNQTQQISPADVRETQGDLLDTETPAYGVAAINPPVTGVSVGTTFQDLTAWNLTVRADSEFTVNTTTGVITANVPCVIKANVNLSFQTPSSKIVTIQTVASSSTFNYQAATQGPGGSDKSATLILLALYELDTNDTIKIQINNEDSAEDFDFPSGVFIVEYVPRISEPT